MSTPPPWDIGTHWAELDERGDYVLTPKPARTCPVCGEPMEGGCHVCEGPPGYDPVPDLAALIDGIGEIARSGGDQRALARVIAGGPYARLRGGLLLDDPRTSARATEAALRLALMEYYENRRQ